MRVTVDIDDELLERMKDIETRLGETLSTQVQDAIRMYLAMPKRAPIPENAAIPEIDLPVFHGTGVRPGIDLNRFSAVLDAMDGLDDPD